MIQMKKDVYTVMKWMQIHEEKLTDNTIKLLIWNILVTPSNFSFERF